MLALLILHTELGLSYEIRFNYKKKWHWLFENDIE